MVELMFSFKNRRAKVAVAEVASPTPARVVVVAAPVARELPLLHCAAAATAAAVRIIIIIVIQREGRDTVVVGNIF